LVLLARETNVKARHFSARQGLTAPRPPTMIQHRTQREGCGMELRREGPDTVLYKEGQAIGRGRLEGGLWLWIDPAWRQRGYGSFLAKGLLRAAGGFDPQTATDFWAEAPRDAAGEALLRKFGFAPGAAGRWRRQRVPDLSAVALCHRMLAAQAKPGGAYLDAT